MTSLEVGDVADLPAPSITRVACGDRWICLVRTAAGSIFAVDDDCPHEGYPLSDGELLDDEIECPAHGSTFDLRSGAVTGPPAMDDVATHPVDVRDGRVIVSVRDS
jgi:nitrite reductase/ring-hydroxylating ferredoxin subunit